MSVASMLRFFVRSFIPMTALLLFSSSTIVSGLPTMTATECRYVALPCEDQSSRIFADIIESVSLSPDGKQIVIAQVSGVYLYDAESLIRRSTLTSPVSERDPIYPAVWSPDGSQIATFTRMDGITVWDAGSRQRLYSLREEDDPGAYDRNGEQLPSYRIYELVWSPDSRYIAAAGDLPLRVWDLRTAQPVFEFDYASRENDHLPGQLLWSSDNTQLLYAEYQRILTWDVKAWRPIPEIRPQPPLNPDNIDSLSLSSSNELARGGLFSYLQIWDLTTKTPILNETGNAIAASTVSWLPGTNHIAVATDPDNRIDRDYGSVIVILDIPSGKVIQRLVGHTGTVNGLQWYPDGKRLLALENHFPTSRLIEWDVETGKMLAEFSVNAGTTPS